MSTGSGIFDIEMLPAENGDCLWIEYGDPKQPRRILIDCGAESTAKLVASRVTAPGGPSEYSFELFVLTHIDADHIDGVLPLFADGALNMRFKDIWFNGRRQVNQFLSFRQGDDFSRMLEDPTRELAWNRATTSADAKQPAPVVMPAGQPPPSFTLCGDMQVTLLSPGAAQLKRLGRQWRKTLAQLKRKKAKATLGRKPPPAEVKDFATFDLNPYALTPERKDRSAPNGSSIALLAEFDGRSILLSGDAHASVLVSSIEALQQQRGRAGQRLKVDALKLSHHGSANATTSALLKAIECPRYLVSSNGNVHYHPDREAIARVILQGGAQPTLFFNYRNPYNRLWEEHSLRQRYDYVTEYPPEGAVGLRVSL